MKRTLILAAALATTVMVAGPATAHHSFAMFDKAKEIELKDAVVVDWQWTSPHTWLYVMVPGAKGQQPMRYSIEGGNPGMMRRVGFGKGTMAPGDHVTVFISPLRSGQPGGAINAIKLANGTLLGERLK